MTPSIHDKLEHLSLRYEEIAALLGEASVIQDQDQFRNLSREYAQLEAIVQPYRAYQQCLQDQDEARQMLDSGDSALAELAGEELPALQQRQQALELELQKLLLPRDERDEANVYLEIRAGTGGDEAAIFAGDLLRMYTRYAEQRGWRMETISAREGEHGGFREVVVRILGQGVFSRLKFESGAHRVQRVPQTESQGRIHTSAATVAILPEVEAIEAVDINPNDLRTDTYRASGAGGQHVNKTDSAIRITHIPTGIVVECQDERSQHKNRAKALALLSARLLDQQRSQQVAEQSESRRLQVGSGDRSERIRTYNFPQGRLTDHRVNLTLYKLEAIMAGELDEVIEPLLTEHQTELLAELSKS